MASFLRDTTDLTYDHSVGLYADDNVLIESLVEYVSAGFDNKEAVILIATPAHLQALNQALSEMGYDLDTAIKNDAYINLDAAAMLEHFMVNNWPVRDLFVNTIIPVLERAAAGNRKIRAFGEMVMLLWKRGLHGATVHLEQCWNDLTRDHDFTLLCAYHTSAFNHGLQSALQHICKAHSKTTVLVARELS
jgi:MEDS: MEthanogen/methylotroph, DcmR Sensory domain